MFLSMWNRTNTCVTVWDSVGSLTAPKGSIPVKMINAAVRVSGWIEFLVFFWAESRAKKAKNWEEVDFYDSDDDTFLDRTGDIERKRQKRISRIKPTEKKTENYQSLVSDCIMCCDHFLR